MNPQLNANEPGVLTCWKDIAQYLGKGVRTVQRWEREFGLPVRRPDGIYHKSPVIAHKRDLDAWLESRWSGRSARRAPDIPYDVNALSPVSELILSSQELRNTHSQLLLETSAALAALVKSCNTLTSLRMNIRSSSQPPRR